MPALFLSQWPLAPSAGSTYRLKLSVLRPSASDALNEVRPIGISMPLGRLAGASLRTSSVIRALLSGISLPFWLPATRVWSRVEATATCWLSVMPPPLPWPARPAEPSGRSRPAARSSRLFGTPSRSSSGAPAPGASGVAGAAGGWGGVGTPPGPQPAAAAPGAAARWPLFSLGWGALWGGGAGGGGGGGGVPVLAAASTVARLTWMRVPSTSTVKDSLVGARSAFPSSAVASLQLSTNWSRFAVALLSAKTMVSTVYWLNA